MPQSPRAAFALAALRLAAFICATFTRALVFSPPFTRSLAFTRQFALPFTFAFTLLALLCVDSRAESFADYQLPSTITLSPNAARQDTTIATAGNGEQTFYHAQSLSIYGAPNATYTLQAGDSTTHFELGRIQLHSEAQGAEAKVALLGYHTLSFGGSGGSSALVLGSGAVFKAILSDKPVISPQASEYGGESKVRFAKDSALILSSNAQAEFTQLRLFIHDGETTLQQGSKLIIEADKAIRFQSALSNHGGEIALTGDVYNVGSTRGDTPNEYTTIADFTSENGRITIAGDFYNGGHTQNAVDTSGSVAGGYNVFDVPFGGGGRLSLYGGSMSITGRLISQRGGDLMAGGEWRNPKDSSINLYGATLSVQGGIENKEGSTITIGSYGGKLGVINGDVVNSGAIVIDLTGVSFAGASFGRHTFLNGTLSGSGSVSLSAQSGAQEFISATLANGNTALELVRNDSAIETFHAKLSHEESRIIQGLDSVLSEAQKGSIYGYGGSRELTQIAQDSQQSLQTENITTPLAALESIQAAHTTTTPITPQILAKVTRALPHYASAHYARATSPYPKNYSAPVPRGYAPYASTPLGSPSYAYTNRFGLDVRAIGGGSFGAHGAGGFGGAEIGGSMNASGHTLRAGFSFLSSTLAQNLPSSATKSTNQAFGLSLSDTIAWKGLELEIGLLGSLGLFNAQHSLTLAGNPAESRAEFMAQRLMGELMLGYRFYAGAMFFKPYAGMRHYLFLQDSIAQSGELISTKLQGYKDYMLNFNVGMQAGFAFAPRASQMGIITARLDYEPHFYNTQKSALLELGSTSIPLTLPYGDKISASMQAQYQIAQNTLFAQIFYTRAFAGLHALGVNAGFAYRF